jgi:hypothetical protein
MEGIRFFRGANCGSVHYLVRSKICLPWICSTDSSAEVNQNVQHTREEDKFNVEQLQDGSVRNLYAERLEDALIEEFEGSSEEMYEYIYTS